jgi:hypothetical protein
MMGHCRCFGIVSEDGYQIENAKKGSEKGELLAESIGPRPQSSKQKSSNLIFLQDFSLRNPLPYGYVDRFPKMSENLIKPDLVIIDATGNTGSVIRVVWLSNHAACSTPPHASIAAIAPNAYRVQVTEH